MNRQFTPPSAETITQASGKTANINSAVSQCSACAAPLYRRPAMPTSGVDNSSRAGDVIGRIRALVKKAPQRKDRLEINGAIREVIELTRGEAQKNGVAVRTQLADGLPLIQGDRVQLQQVILNLIVNAVQAMSGVSEGSRELLISTGAAESDDVLVAVRDTGPGLPPSSAEHLFDAFYTTKADGMGMGLSICRSIIEAHGGRLWASANLPRGAVFQFTAPAYAGEQSP